MPQFTPDQYIVVPKEIRGNPGKFGLSNADITGLDIANDQSIVGGNEGFGNLCLTNDQYDSYLRTVQVIQAYEYQLVKKEFIPVKFTIGYDDHAEDIIDKIDSALSNVGFTIEPTEGHDGWVDYEIVKWVKPEKKKGSAESRAGTTHCI